MINRQFYRFQTEFQWILSLFKETPSSRVFKIYTFFWIFARDIHKHSVVRILQILVPCMCVCMWTCDVWCDLDLSHRNNTQPTRRNCVCVRVCCGKVDTKLAYEIFCYQSCHNFCSIVQFFSRPVHIWILIHRIFHCLIMVIRTSHAALRRSLFLYLSLVVSRARSLSAPSHHSTHSLTNPHSSFGLRYMLFTSNRIINFRCVAQFVCVCVPHTDHVFCYRFADDCKR